jgi:NAD(P)-dependent dehydrogenase (short-subunit alcohol dehydrogenase family)
MNRTVIITGATGKFGKVLVQKFLKKGYVVVAIGKSKIRLNQLKIYSSKKNQNLFLVCIDLMKNASITKFIKVIKKLGLNPYALINNARNLDYSKLDKNGKPSTKNFLNEFKLGVVVPYELTQALVASFPGKFRKVLNLSSIYGSVAPNKKLYKNTYKKSPIQYGVTKSAVEHLTKELSVRLAKKSISVNCVAFGGVEGRENKAFMKRYSELCPSGRMLTEDEIFNPIEFLISNKTSGITGHVLMVDGGWTAW